MKHYAVAFALWLLTLYWGAGLAWLLTPGRWKKFWPIWAPFAGWALQSAVVWQGTRMGLVGTDTYGLVSLLLPSALLAYSLWKRKVAWFRDVGRLWPIWLLSLCCLAALCYPLSQASHGLTTVSLGSCDAADYAAGARVLKEFARTDRSGFLGLTEVVQLHSVDNFYDHWLRLNHFTPSALVALNCSILQSEPFHLISLLTASLLSLSLPLVYWLSRTLLRFGEKIGLLVTLLFGLCPITWYAVFQVAPGQMLAAQAIAAISWGGIMLWRQGNISRRDVLEFGLLLLTAYWLILGSYNFIVIVCLVSAVSYVGLCALTRGGWSRLLPWTTMMIVPLGIAVVLFAERARGLAERFLLFRQFDFGWRIPALSPEAWFGMVANVQLFPYSSDIRWALSIAVLLLLGLGLAWEIRRKSGRACIAFCLCVPALAGYEYLVIRGAILGTNASYDAYKLFSVFFPGILPALCLGLMLLYRSKAWRIPVALAFAGIIGLNVLVASQYIRRVSAAPLRVDTALSDLKQVDAMEQVKSVNMLIPDFWDRLWANAFLLKKQQYFETYTYEGRRNTPLKGDWDLQGGLIRILSPKPADYILVNGFFSLHNTHSPFFARATLGSGWHDRERFRTTRWLWSRGSAEIMLHNLQKKNLRMNARITLRSPVERDLQFWIGNTLVGKIQVGVQKDVYPIPEFSIPPGTTRLDIRSSVPPDIGGPNDRRMLGICLFGLDFQVLQEEREKAEPKKTEFIIQKQ